MDVPRRLEGRGGGTPSIMPDCGDSFGSRPPAKQTTKQGGNLLEQYKRTVGLPDPEGVLRRNPQKPLVEHRITSPQMPHSISSLDIKPDADRELTTGQLKETSAVGPELAEAIEIDPDLALPVQEANALAPWNPEDAANESRESFDLW